MPQIYGLSRQFLMKNLEDALPLKSTLKNARENALLGIFEN